MTLISQQWGFQLIPGIRSNTSNSFIGHTGWVPHYAHPAHIDIPMLEFIFAAPTPTRPSLIFWPRICAAHHLAGRVNVPLPHWSSFCCRHLALPARPAGQTRAGTLVEPVDAITDHS